MMRRSMSRGPNRRHSPQFKLQLCHNMRAGTIGRKEAQRKFTLLASLVHLWLMQYDRGEADVRAMGGTRFSGCRARVRALRASSLPMRHIQLLEQRSGHFCRSTGPGRVEPPHLIKR